jgi:hypothetical protein
MPAAVPPAASAEAIAARRVRRLWAQERSSWNIWMVLLKGRRSLGDASLAKRE